MTRHIERGVHNPNLVAFRASDCLAAAVADHARRSGVSVSEYLRTVVREKVGLN